MYWFHSCRESRRMYLQDHHVTSFSSLFIWGEGSGLLLTKYSTTGTCRCMCICLSIESTDKRAIDFRTTVSNHRILHYPLPVSCHQWSNKIVKPTATNKYKWSYHGTTYVGNWNLSIHKQDNQSPTHQRQKWMDWSEKGKCCTTTTTAAHACQIHSIWSQSHFDDGWLMMTIHVPCSIIFRWWLQYRSTNEVFLWWVWRRRRWQRRRCPPPPLWSMKVIWISTLWTYIISWTSRFNALVNRLSSLGTDGFLYINIRNRWIVGGSYHHRWHAGDVAVSDQNRFSCSVV